MPGRATTRLRRLALVFALLGGLGLIGHHWVQLQRVTVAIGDLAPAGEGFLRGDFARPWPLKINKTTLDRIVVVLADGTELKHASSRAALARLASGAGFVVERPEILFRLDGTAVGGPDATLTVTLPVNTRATLGA